MTRYRRLRQKPIRGGRVALPSCVLQDIWREVDRQATRFNCSRSFVIATALAHVFHIEEQEDYKKAKVEQSKKNLKIVRSTKAS